MTVDWLLMHWRRNHFFVYTKAYREWTKGIITSMFLAQINENFMNSKDYFAGWMLCIVYEKQYLASNIYVNCQDLFFFM